MTPPDDGTPVEPDDVDLEVDAALDGADPGVLPESLRATAEVLRAAAATAAVPPAPDAEVAARAMFASNLAGSDPSHGDEITAPVPIVDEVTAPVPIVLAERRARRRRVALRGAAAVGALSVLSGAGTAAATGHLPGPVQRSAASALVHLHIDLPGRPSRPAAPTTTVVTTTTTTTVPGGPPDTVVLGPPGDVTGDTTTTDLSASPYPGYGEVTTSTLGEGYSPTPTTAPHHGRVTTTTVGSTTVTSTVGASTTVTGGSPGSPTTTGRSTTTAPTTTATTTVTTTSVPTTSAPTTRPTVPPVTPTTTP